MSGSRKHGRKTPVFRLLIVSAVLCVTAAAVYVIAELAERKVNKELNDSQQADSSAENIVVDGKKTIQVNGKTYALKKNIETILLMGVDNDGTVQTTESYRNDNVADFLLVVALDHSDGSYKSLAINRDTMAQVPVLSIKGTFVRWSDGQISLAHTYGSGTEDSCRNQVRAVSELLYQLDIDHYASFSIPAIGIANDAVGGVTVTIEDDFGEAHPEMAVGETVKLNAEQAELFVRGRATVADKTNVNRMSRQKTYIKAWRELAINKLNSNSNFFLDLLGMTSDYMVSDMTVNQLSDFANQVAAYEDKGTFDIAGESRKGEKFMEFVYDENDLRQKVLDLWYTEITDSDTSDE